MIALCIILGISLIANALLIYALKNLLLKHEKLEDSYESNQVWMFNIKQTIEFLNNRLKQIDTKGAFASDDEVGIFFKELQNMQDLLNKACIVESIEK